MRRFLLFGTSVLLGWLLAAPAGAQVLDPAFRRPTGVYLQAEVAALGPAQADGKRLVAGNFELMGGKPAYGLARVDATGALDQEFTNRVGQSAGVQFIQASPGGQYLLGAPLGSVTAGGLTRANLLRLHADGTADTSFNIGWGPRNSQTTYISSCTSVAVQPDSKVLVVGDFNNFGGMPANRVARLQANGSPDPTFSVGTGVGSSSTGDQVWVVALLPTGQVLVGGHFTTFNGQLAYGLVRLNADGSRDLSFPVSLPADATVTGLLVQPDGGVLVSGDTGATNGTTFLRRLLATGAPDPGFQAPALSITSGVLGVSAATQLPNGQLLVTGFFTETPF